MRTTANTAGGLRQPNRNVFRNADRRFRVRVSQTAGLASYHEMQPLGASLSKSLTEGMRPTQDKTTSYTVPERLVLAPLDAAAVATDR